MTKAKRFVLYGLVAAVCVILAGCAGTLDETRGAIHVRALAGARITRDAATCDAISSKERIWTGVATGGAIASGAAGVATFPVTSHLGDQILSGLTIGSAITAGVGLAIEQSYSRDWQTKGCDQ